MLCRNAPQGFGEKFNRLFNGDISEYTSKGQTESDADMALAGMIAFHTSDIGIIKAIIQESSLWDEKWEREDYCFGTIDKVIANSRFGKVNKVEKTTPDEEPQKSEIEMATPDEIIVPEGPINENEVTELYLPKGYAISKDGLVLLKYDPKSEEYYPETICHSPISLTGIAQEIDSKEISYEVSFTDVLGHHSKSMYKQDELIISTKLKATPLASRINIIDRKIGSLCEYFNKSIKENAERLPRSLTVKNNGWRKEEAFVIGDRLITEDGIKTVNTKDEDTSLLKKGSLEGWKKAILPVIGDYTVRFKCYCTLTAMLLRLLDVQSFVVDHNGDSSQGKTFGFQVAVSIYGNPVDRMLAASSTPNFIEQKAITSNDLPLFIDETSIQTQEVLKDIVYRISNETEKGRADKDAKAKKVNKWKTIGLTTGEASINENTTFNGAQVRVVSIRQHMSKMPFGVIETTHVGIIKNYGHVIDLYMVKVLKNKQHIKTQFQSFQNQFMHEDNSNMMNRSASLYAAIASAGIILEDVFKDIGIPTVNPIELVQKFYKDANSIPFEDRKIRALRYLNDKIQGHINNFIENDNVTHPAREVYGYISDEFIDMIPQKAKDILTEEGFSKSIIDEWISDGIIITNTGRKDYKISLKSNGKQLHVLRFNRSKIDELLDI